MTNPRWTPPAPGSLAGRTAIVTGANSGLGRASALALAGAGAKVVMACRDLVKAEEAADAVRGAHPGSCVETRRLDLADLASVFTFARDHRAQGDRLDILLNNAGVMALDESRTRDGFESQFGINHLGHFALTMALLPVLCDTPGISRVVTVSSMGHRAGRLHLDDVMYERRRYRRWGAYFQSKLANLAFAAELDRRLRERGWPVESLAAHPGTASTELGKVGSSATNWVLRSLFPVVGRGPSAGAASQLRACLDPDAVGGQFWGPRWMVAGAAVLERPSRRARDVHAAGALWNLSEDLTGVGLDQPLPSTHTD
jgi:NAD(P)-dependent dehydrogenase (short-subunit alcohol dehydrogenase family)